MFQPHFRTRPIVDVACGWPLNKTKENKVWNLWPQPLSDIPAKRFNFWYKVHSKSGELCRVENRLRRLSRVGSGALQHNVNTDSISSFSGYHSCVKINRPMPRKRDQCAARPAVHSMVFSSNLLLPSHERKSWGRPPDFGQGGQCAMCIASATASYISLAISRMHYVQSNAQHCPIKFFPWNIFAVLNVSFLQFFINCVFTLKFAVLLLQWW